MRWLRTIWDIKENWGQSTVQALWDKCTKIYPSSLVDRGQLEEYHKFQSSLWCFEFPVSDELIKAKGFNKIHITFLSLDPFDIMDGCVLDTWKTVLITQPDFIRWIDLVQSDYWIWIRSDVDNFFKNHTSREIRFLHQKVYGRNIKIVKCDNGVISLVCTDAFWNIPEMVNELLSWRGD